MSLRHLEKSILEGNLYLGPLEIILRTLASGMTFRSPVITCPAEASESTRMMAKSEIQHIRTSGRVKTSAIKKLVESLTLSILMDFLL